MNDGNETIIPPLTEPQRRYRSLAELRGARLGTTSLKEGTRHVIESMLERAGLRYPQDYSFGIAGAHPRRWEALKAGTIDAAVQMTPFDYVAEDAGFSSLGEIHRYVPDFRYSYKLRCFPGQRERIGQPGHRNSQ